MIRVAIVHDNFAQMGGAERVTESIHRLFPEADLLTTLSIPERLSSYLLEAKPKNTWMQYLPFKKKLFRAYFLLYPFAVEQIDLREYDLVITSCFGYAKGVKRREGAVHICYCHNPMRWVWRSDKYITHTSRGSLGRLLLKIPLLMLKRWEQRAALRPDHYVTNSETVKVRLRRAFGVDALVIPPPVETGRFTISSEVEDYYLVVSRLVSYKRIDLAVKACTQKGERLIVIGSGPELERLRSMAGPSVSFAGQLSDQEVASYASRCKALLVPGEEDFGITPLEVNAAGRPVIAYAAGGALETVREGVNGIFFAEQTVASLRGALERCEGTEWDPHAIRAHAETYDTVVFHKRMLAMISECLSEHTASEVPLATT
ncbi:glycosyltransferase [Terriglobus roseus]|uniref:glycosyltransferase n=1 Tax=Terriglobus roseus TaxID=392734 RepID=UPI001FCE0AEC|nr:glycosyltransferase [Terriglobus roseus]